MTTSDRKSSRWLRPWLLILPTTCAALTVFALVGIAAAATGTAPWVAPAAARATKNPVPATAANLADAKAVYTQTCSTCHGDKGDGQGLMGSSLEPQASNFTDAKHMRPQTDGELFWKVSEGRGPMPSFKSQLTDMQIWQLVDYVRRFSKAAPAKKPPVHKPE